MSFLAFSSNITHPSQGIISAIASLVVFIEAKEFGGALNSESSW